MGLLKDTTASVLGNTADVLDDTAKAIESDGKTETSAAAPASDDTAAKANTTTSASQEGATTSASNGETVPSGTPSGMLFSLYFSRCLSAVSKSQNTTKSLARAVEAQGFLAFS